MNVLRRESLSRQQLRMMQAISRMEAVGEEGHDFVGDLSICSRNPGATMRSLERRGFVTSHFEGHQAPLEEAWTYRLADAGQQAMAATEESGQGGE